MAGRFPAALTLRRENFVQELDSFFAGTWRLRIAEFEVASLVVKQESPVIFLAGVRYDLVGPRFKDDCEARVGRWDLESERGLRWKTFRSDLAGCGRNS